MKKVIYGFIIVLSLFLIDVNVYARQVEGTDGAGASGATSGSSKRYLSNKNYTLECIYLDGSLFTFEYSTGKESHYINKTFYPLTGTSGSESSDRTILYANDIYKNSENYQTKGTCASHIWKYTSESVSYYKFGGKNNNYSCDSTKEDFSWYDCVFESIGNSFLIGLCQQDPSTCVGALDPDSELYKEMMNAFAETSEQHLLVSERYILSSEYDEPNNVFYYVIPSEQAAGNDSYIKIMTYENVVLLEKEGRVTRLSGSVADKFQKATNGKAPYEKIYLNSPEPMPSTTSSSTTSYSFKKGQTIYSISESKDSTHTKEYTYTSEQPEGSTTDDSLCTQRLKNTSPILKIIIQYSQILIPAIVLIITGIDIGKIVVAGNFEEEMPKRKKLIITRLIVMVVFFFLPLFVRLIITLIKDSGIGDNKTISNGILYIDCLFDPNA